MIRKSRVQVPPSPSLSREELIAAFGALCSRLEAPLPAEEYAAGWNETKKENFLKWFRDIEDKLKSGGHIPYLSLARNLDHSGISSGMLFKEVCRLDGALNERKW